VVIAVFRRPEMLLALLSERREPFDAENSGHADPYVDRLVPFASVPEELCPWRDKDLKAWKSLGRVPGLSGRAARAIIRSLLASVPLPDMSFEEPAPVSLGRGIVDLRPLLCHPSGEEWMLGQLGDALPGKGESELPDWHWHRRRELAELPEDLRRYFLWSLALAPWESIEVAQAIHQTLGLAKDRSLLRAVALLLRRSGSARFPWWCDVLAELDPARRVRACELIIELGAAPCMPSDELRAAVHAADEEHLATTLRDLAAASA
jgi:hypothetical protein